MKTRSRRSPGRGTRADAPIRSSRKRSKAFAQLLHPRGGPRGRSPKTRGDVPPEPITPRRRETRPETREERLRTRPPENETRENEAQLEAREPLEPFSPLPSVIASSTPTSSPEVAAVGTSWDRAQVAAMAERMLTSFRRGEVDGRDEVRMQLRLLDAEVRVRVDEGRVVATLVGDGLEGLASTLERELQARGLESEITLAPD